MGNFDPLGFSEGADVLEMNRLRESELLHGRVGMLASAGFLVQEKFHPLFSADGGPASEQASVSSRGAIRIARVVSGVRVTLW